MLKTRRNIYLVIFLAFKEAFDIFDKNGGGTIDALELKKTLESVGIILEEEEIHDVMMRLDKDGEF